MMMWSDLYKMYATVKHWLYSIWCNDGRFMIEIRFPQQPDRFILCDAYAGSSIGALHRCYIENAGLVPRYSEPVVCTWYTDEACEHPIPVEDMNTCCLQDVDGHFGSIYYVKMRIQGA
jgi:hypothetical protein